MTYEVEFRINNKTPGSIRVEATNAGSAFAAAQKAHPDAVMIRATAGVLSPPPTHGETVYDPPPVQRPLAAPVKPCRAPKRDERDGVMPFYDEVVGKGYQP